MSALMRPDLHSVPVWRGPGPLPAAAMATSNGPQEGQDNAASAASPGSPLGRLRASGQDGFVTAETALVLPTVVGVALSFVLLVAVAAQRVRCEDAAWEIARNLARGEPVAFTDAAVREYAPPGAKVSIGREADVIEVRVETRTVLAGSLLPPLTVSGAAAVVCEPGTPCAAAPCPVIPPVQGAIDEGDGCADDTAAPRSTR